MNSYGYHTANIRPLSSAYVSDADVTLNNIVDYTSEGIGMHFVNALSGIEDVTTNSYNTLYLTSPKPVDNILNVNIEATQYPYYRTTYFKVSGSDLFIKDKYVSFPRASNQLEKQMTEVATIFDNLGEKEKNNKSQTRSASSPIQKEDIDSSKDIPKAREILL